MDPRNVQLSLKEEAIVILKTIRDMAPWRYFVMPVIGFLVGGYKFDCGCGSVAGFSVLTGIIGLVIGVVLNVFLLLIAPVMFSSLFEHLSNIYEKHRTNVQKKVLDDSDDIILK